MKRLESPTHLFILFFIIGILIGVFLIVNKEEEEFIPFPLPKQAQFISLKTRKITPLSHIKEELYAINIFATWCESCVMEYPIIEKLSEKLTVYGISYNDSIEDLKEFFNHKKNIYHDIFLDHNNQSMKYLGTSLIPEIFIVRKDKVIYRFTGMLTEDIINTKILPKI